MNREEKIFATAKMYSLKNYGDDDDRAFAIKDFQAGAQWADDNPKSPWIRVEDRLPKTDDFGVSEDVLMLKDGIVTLGNYFDGEDRWMKWITWEAGFAITPTHWMPIPKLPNVEPKK